MPSNPYTRATRGFHPLTLVAAFAIFVLAVHNDRLWRAIFAVWPDRSASDLAFLASVAVVLFVAISLPLQLVSQRHAIKPLLALLAAVAAGVSYFADNFGVTVERTMIANIAETDPNEVRDLLSWSLAWHLLLTGALPAAVLLAAPVRVVRWRTDLAVRAAALTGCLIALAGSAALFYQDYASLLRNNRQLRQMVNPVAPVWYGIGHLAIVLMPAKAQGPLQTIAATALRRTTPDSGERRPVLTVLAIGETARAANFGLTGYARDTTPELARLGVTAFEAESCATSTAESVPCLFAPFGREGFTTSRARGAENLLDLLIRAGFDVLWLDNNAGCKGVCARVPTERMSDLSDPAYCRDGECDDGILARRIEEIAAATRRDTVVVMHMIGSHGPAYYKRYPPTFRRFEPTCDTNQIQNCSREAIANTYDNTVLYTDHVLARAIRALAGARDRFDGALLYVSDHGESLGEGGLYLHGVPFAFAPKFQTRVPMVVWTSDGYLRQRMIDAGCLRAPRNDTLSHYNFFHTVLGLLDIETDAYRPALDPFASCRASGGRS